MSQETRTQHYLRAWCPRSWSPELSRFTSRPDLERPARSQGQRPSSSTSKLMLRKVRIATIAARTPTLWKVGAHQLDDLRNVDVAS